MKKGRRTIAHPIWNTCDAAHTLRSSLPTLFTSPAQVLSMGPEAHKQRRTGFSGRFLPRLQPVGMAFEGAPQAGIIEVSCVALRRLPDGRWEVVAPNLEPCGVP